MKTKQSPGVEADQPKSRISIPVSQLRVGIYVELDGGWMEHPFFFKRFLIKDQQQLKAIQSLQLDTVFYNPEKSTVEPVSAGGEVVVPAADDAEIKALWDKKIQRIEALKKHRRDIGHCNKRFSESIDFIKHSFHNVRSSPEQTLSTAIQFVRGLVGDILGDRDTALQLVHVSHDVAQDYAHMTNVTVLALMLGNALELPEKEMTALGVGALFHDIGKLSIPDRLVLSQKLSKAESGLFEMHCDYGVKIASQMPGIPKAALAIIMQHHEMVDGSGYPKGLSDKKIHRLAKLVAIADSYDTLCARSDKRSALSPYEAISIMYARDRKKFDQEMLQLFIKILGVYPPGSVVELSNGEVGQVISVNGSDLLNPFVQLYTPGAGKDELVYIDMSEENELSISKSVRPAEFPADLIEFFSLGDKICHFVSGQG